MDGLVSAAQPENKQTYSTTWESANAAGDRTAKVLSPCQRESPSSFGPPSAKDQ